jgi:gamma-glutamylcyclotransferase (GGCT)/AIG2-like uncharacterized protein YtfP
MPTTIFVYGSLLQGEPNHGQLQGATALGSARTAPRFTLVHVGEFPALVAGGADAVSGELYEVDAAHLTRLDAFEGHPDHYVRMTVTLEDGREVLGYGLPAERATGTRIAGGDWRSVTRDASRRDR